MQVGVIAFRSPTGEFLDDEPIFDKNETSDYNPLDDFIGYIAERMVKKYES